MDKNTARDKRKSDKYHKKPPPVKSKKQQTTKETEPSYNFIPKERTDDPFDDSQYSKGTVQVVDWEKRKLPDEIEQEGNSEDEQLDFGELLQMPTSVSGHFFFSTEKNWESEQTSIINSKAKYFNLDTKLLNSCLRSIPFNERQGYEDLLFTEVELKSMKFAAEEQEKIYLKNLNIDSLLIAKKMSQPEGRTNEPVIPTPSLPTFVNCTLMIKLPPDMPVHLRREDPQQPPQLQQLPQIQQVSSIPPKQETTLIESPKTATNEKEDIQKWLDDILDD